MLHVLAESLDRMKLSHAPEKTCLVCAWCVSNQRGRRSYHLPLSVDVTDPPSANTRLTILPWSLSALTCYLSVSQITPSALLAFFLTPIQRSLVCPSLLIRRPLFSLFSGESWQFLHLTHRTSTKRKVMQESRHRINFNRDISLCGFALHSVD